MKCEWLKLGGIAFAIILTSCSLMAQWTIWTPSNSDYSYISGPRGISGTIWRPKGTNTTYINFLRVHTFRGGLKNSIFADKEIVKRFDELIWIDACMSKNPEKMAQAAWLLKGIEKMLGKQDKKITSKIMFEAAARVAIAQHNLQALKEIIALAPECKKFQDELKLTAPTRGKIGSIIPMPELVVMPKVAPGKKWIKKINELKPYQQPVYSPALLKAQFRGISTEKAQNISFLVNRGRVTLNPKLIAMGALELVDQTLNNSLPQFDAKKILAEAASLAIELGDKNSLDFIIGLYETSALKNKEKEKELKEELKLISNTRGLTEPEKKRLWIGVIVLTAKALLYCIN